MSKHTAPFVCIEEAFQMEYTEEALVEARRQIASALHKTEKVIETFEAKENP